jgi:putative nucleotidyltransferase with HDIG domain
VTPSNLHSEIAEWRDAGVAVAEIERRLRERGLDPEIVSNLVDLLTKQQALFASTIENLVRAIELRDAYTGEHSQRVTRFATLLGQQLQLPAKDLELIRVGAPLHDIGKIGIDDAILRKPGKLTPAEFEVMKTHTTMGAEIIAKVPDLASVVPIVRSHHERWNGSGYPDGLQGKNIPRLARIVAVGESFDAMVFDTPYRRGQAAEIAFAEIERQQGLQFDPEVVTAFLKVRDKVVQEMRRIEKEGEKAASGSEASRPDAPPDPARDRLFEICNSRAGQAGEL